MDRMTVNFISNFISTKISEKIKLDPGQFVFLTTIVSSVLFQIDFGAHFNHLMGACVVCIMIFTGYMLFKKWRTIKSVDESKYCSIRIFSDSQYDLIRFMMVSHPEFWKTDFDMEIGNPFYRNFVFGWTPQENVSIHFNDTIHNVKGYMIIRKVDPPKELSKTELEKLNAVRCADLFIEKCGISGDKYMKMLEEYRARSLSMDTSITLYMLKVLGSGDDKIAKQNHIVTMYTGPKNDREKRYQDYMCTYFSEQRDKLWKYISNVHYNPEHFRKCGQEARANLLLYGPPGTGKSAFAYRLAVSLGRHIVSVDLTALCHNKHDVYQIIQRADIKGYPQAPSDYIVLLEEFDITFMHLYEKKQNKPTLENGFQNKEGKKVEEYSRSVREFELEDLLELLQGPVPIPGSIIIATTNKYEEMSKLCPALFRAGRLTPCEFTNISWKSLQEMTMHYFKKELTIPQMEITISTSDIIENALIFSLYDDGFTMFESFLRSKMRIC